MNHKRLLWFCVTITVFTFVVTTRAAIAAEVYYGPGGVNYVGCGTAPCRTYSYASAQACRISDSTQSTVYIYHVRNGYAGFCDKVGGGGTEPFDREGGIPYDWSNAIWSFFAMLVAGFTIGKVGQHNFKGLTRG